MLKGPNGPLFLISSASVHRPRYNSRDEAIKLNPYTYRYMPWIQHWAVRNKHVIVVPVEIHGTIGASEPVDCWGSCCPAMVPASTCISDIAIERVVGYQICSANLVTPQSSPKSSHQQQPYSHLQSPPTSIIESCQLNTGSTATPLLFLNRSAAGSLNASETCPIH